MQGTAKIRASFSAITASGDFGIAIPLFVIVAITAMINPAFLTISNFSSILRLMPFIAMCALGVSFPLITGTNDISVGKIAGLAGMLFAYLMMKKGMGVLPAAVASVAVGGLLGSVSGLMISWLRVPDFVMTLGVMYIADAARYLLTNGYPLTPLPYNLGEFGKREVLGMSWPFWIVLAIFALAYFTQRKTVFGRQLYAIGGSREVAKLAGINVVRNKTLAYMIGGICTSIGGILLTLHLNNALPQNGDDWGFKAIVACAVGGVSLKGGRGSALGVFIGIFIVRLLDNALVMVNVPAEYQKCFTGVVLAASVMYDLAKQRRKVRA